MSVFTRFEVRELHSPAVTASGDTTEITPGRGSSGAYLTVTTIDGHQGNALAPIDGDSELQLLALQALRTRLLGRRAEPVLANLAEFSAELLNDTLLRWLGPGRGPAHLAIDAVMNALWDLRASREGTFLPQLLRELPVAQLPSGAMSTQTTVQC